MTRQPNPIDQGILGSSDNMPFTPAGMEIASEHNKVALDFENLLTVPPGFQTGMNFDVQLNSQFCVDNAKNSELKTLLENMGSAEIDEKEDNVRSKTKDFATVEEDDDKLQIALKKVGANISPNI